jgi:hypothetical protein
MARGDQGLISRECQQPIEVKLPFPDVDDQP